MAQAWPSISAPSKFIEESIVPQIEEEADNGAFFTRRQGTLTKKQFTLGWDLMTNADKVTLDTYHSAYKGGEISYPHPITAVAWTVKFVGQSLAFERVEPDYWKIELKLRQK